MSQNSQASAAAPQSNGQGMRSEIAGKWPKLSAAEITALKSKEDLVKQVQSTYALDAKQARTDVDTFAAGRQL